MELLEIIVDIVSIVFYSGAIVYIIRRWNK